jgi:hypothetical protein
LRIKSSLFLFGAGCVVPLLVLIAIVGYFLTAHMREALLHSAIDRNRAFMTAVDTEVRVHITTLNALATVRSLDTGDLAAFRGDAERALKSQPGLAGDRPGLSRRAPNRKHVDITAVPKYVGSGPTECPAGCG